MLQPVLSPNTDQSTGRVFFPAHTEGVGCTNSCFGVTVQDHKMVIFWLLLSMLCVRIFYQGDKVERVGKSSYLCRVVIRKAEWIKAMHMWLS